MFCLYCLHSVEDFSLCTFDSHCDRYIHDYSSFAVCVAACAASNMSSFLSMLCKSSVFVSSAVSLVTTSAVSFGLDVLSASSGNLNSGSAACLTSSVLNIFRHSSALFFPPVLSVTPRTRNQNSILECQCCC